MQVKIKGLDRTLRRTAATRQAAQEAMLNDLRAQVPLNEFREVHPSGEVSEITANALYCNPTIRLSYQPVAMKEYNTSDPLSLPPQMYHISIAWTSEAGIRIADPVELRLNGRFFGLCVPSLKTLILSNFLFDGSGVRAFAQVWPQIKSDFDFQPVAQPTAPLPDAEKPRIPVTVGADPEFELLDSYGSVVTASSVVDHMDGQVGRDSAGAQVELRPTYATTPVEFVRNMRDVFKKFNEQYRDYHLSSIGNSHPIGGHIHIGVGRSFVPEHEFLQVLDAFIGIPTIGLSGLARGDYAQVSAVREEPWGFEYRTPPSAIFVRPGITRIIIKAIKNLVDKYVNEKEITYENPPGLEDYKRLCGLTEGEHKQFKRFCEKFKEVKSDRNLGIATAFWLNKKPPKKPRTANPVSRVIFHGLWTREVQQDIRERVANLLRQYRGGTYNVILYGYHRNKGLVTNLRITGMTNVAGDVGRGTTDLRIGLPWAVRNDTLTWQRYNTAIMREIESSVTYQQGHFGEFEEV